MMGPVGPLCQSLQRIVGKGWGNDNAKRVCGLPTTSAPPAALLSAAAAAAAAEEECVIYSIGGHGEWGFEYGARRRSPRARRRSSRRPTARNPLLKQSMDGGRGSEGGKGRAVREGRGRRRGRGR
jgi:hypothetical protein